MDHAVFLLPILTPRMSDAHNGTGINKSVSNALTTGSSTRTTFVYLFPINAPLMINPALAFLAIKAITSTKENANLPPFNRSVMSAVLPGTGTNKFAFNAQTTGFSTKTTFVSQSQTNALLSITLEPANHAIKVTI